MSILKRFSVPACFPLPSFDVAGAVFFCLFFATLALSFSPAWAANDPGSMMPVGLLEGTSSPTDIHSTPDIIFGLFIGIMLTAAAYLFFIWIVLRDRSQVLLMFLLIFLGINMASTNDAIMSLVGVYDQTMISLLQKYSIILAYIFSALFSISFLELDITAPYMKTPLLVLTGVLTLLLVVTVINQQPAHFLLPILGALSLGLVLLSGLAALWARATGSLAHLTAFAFFLLGALGESLYDLDILGSELASKNVSYAAFSMASVLFALVIAGQFAARQEEKERALYLSNERFLLAARGSNEGLFEWNRVTGKVYFSGQFRKIMGVGIESNRRGLKEWVRLIHPNDRIMIFRTLRRFRLKASATVISFEYRIRAGEQKWRWIHTKAVATRDPMTQAITRFVGSIGDVTERKRNEAKLRASEARFRSITEAHPVPVLIIDLESKEVLYASPGAEGLLGLPTGMLLGHKLDRFLPIAQERGHIIDLLTRGENVNMQEVTIARGDAENIPAAVSARRIAYQNGQAMVLGLYDLTERKEAEKQIAQQQEALQQSEKMAALGSLLAGVAHELNNPLSVVMGQTSLLIETQKDEKIVKRGEKIYKAADRCSRIVKSFLSLARRKPPERKEVNINPIIENALELLGYQIRNAQVETNLHLDTNLPAIIGDEDQMTQVVTNLELNAAQALQDWEGPRELKITSEVADEDHVRLIFADTGPGIPEELRTKVFEPFFSTKGGGGTGVGLSLCINVVEGHGGSIKLSETPGGGATFTIILPTAKAAERQAAQKETEEKTDTPKGSYRILIVDDEVELSQTLADLLEPFGHDIDLAANGQIAFDKICKRDFDVIISDLRMPVLDGPGLYAKLAAEKPAYTKKILYVTGDTLSQNVHEFLSQNPVPVIEKPYKLADVQTALAKLLKETPSHSNIDGR